MLTESCNSLFFPSLIFRFFAFFVSSFLFFSLSLSRLSTIMCRHRQRPVHAQVKRQEREREGRENRSGFSLAYAVGRLEHCDANVSNRSSQPTICPFVHRGGPTLREHREVHAKPNH